MAKRSMVYPYYETLLSNKKECTMMHMTTWRNLNDSMPSEKSSLNPGSYMIFFLNSTPKMVQVVEMEN